MGRGARFRAASTMIRLGDLSVVTGVAPSDRIDAAGYLIGVGAWTASTAAVLRPLIGKPNMLMAAAVNAPEYLTS